MVSTLHVMHCRKKAPVVDRDDHHFRVRSEFSTEESFFLNLAVMQCHKRDCLFYDRRLLSVALYCFGSPLDMLKIPSFSAESWSDPSWSMLPLVENGWRIISTIQEIKRTLESPTHLSTASLVSNLNLLSIEKARTPICVLI